MTTALEDLATELTAVEQARAEVARRGLLPFTLYTRPDYEINWHHKLVASKLDAVLAGTCRRLMIFEPPQNGKALAVETPIPTPDGWRCIGDLKPWELVFDYAGDPTLVTAVSPVWKHRRVFSVSLDTGESLLADESHEWVVSTDHKRRDRLSRYETKTLAARRKGPTECMRRSPAVIHHLGLNLPEQPLMIDPYTLGVWLGDGTSGSAIITGGDQDLSWIRARVSLAYETSNQATLCTFGVLGLRSHLRLLQLLNNKHIPSIYLRAGRAQRLALLQGLVDTDGYVGPNGYIEFCSTNKRLAENTRELVVSLGAKATVLDGRATIYGRDCGAKYRVMFFMPEAASLPRKAKKCRAQERPDHFLDIEEAGESETVCIEVASPQHLFLAGPGMVPTCNSEQVSRRFPAYAFGRNPDLRIIACSYAMALSQDMSRDVQKIMASREYRALFSKTHLAERRWEIDPITKRRTHAEKRTQGQFDIVGHKGSYNAAGVDGPITGKTADIGIIDDPVKNRAEAESEVYRDRVWEWYKSAFATRQFGSNGAIILCMTRWHDDDLAGRLLRIAAENLDADQWDVVCLPAIAEVQERYRDIGGALWPQKYPLSELKRRRAGMGEYDWAALYQQHPAPSGGGLFKEDWFAGKFVDAAPVVARRARGWDTAATDGGGDYTCGVKIAEAEGIFYVEDVIRGQWSPGVAEAQMRLAIELDGPLVAQREEKEGGSAGKTVIEARTKTFAGVNYEGVPISGSKVTRSKPFRVQCEAGNVRIVRDRGRGGVSGQGWNRDYVNELCGFPTAKNDDQVDGSSCAFNAVLLEPPPFDYKTAGLTSEATW